MKTLNPRKIIITAASMAAILPVTGSAYALSSSPAVVPGQSSQADATKLSNIKSHGDAEISRRLATLNTLDGKISSAAKLNASDKSSLTAEVNSEISGLTSLKSQLDGETTVAAAVTDAKNIVSGYRVYALVAPKIMIIKTADDQQVVEGKLSALSTKLQTRLNSAKDNGKNVSALQTSLDDLNAQVSAASAISSSVESKVIGLQPTDYNSDHTILSGYRSQLQTAHGDNQKAITDAKTIVKGLKSL